MTRIYFLEKKNLFLIRNKEIIQLCVPLFWNTLYTTKNMKSLIINIQKHNIYTKKKLWKKNSNKRLNGLTQWRLEHISNFRQIFRTKMRPKDMICQNLLFTLTFCSLSNFQSSSTRFAVYLLPFVSITFCKFERNFLTGYNFITKSLGSVFF